LPALKYSLSYCCCVEATSQSLSTSMNSLRHIYRRSWRWKDHFTLTTTLASTHASTLLHPLVTREFSSCFFTYLQV